MFQSENGLARYVKRRRLERARIDLSSPSQRHRTIAEIGEAIGYLHAQDFIRAFRREFGTSPGSSANKRAPSAECAFWASTAASRLVGVGAPHQLSSQAYPDTASRRTGTATPRGQLQIAALTGDHRSQCGGVVFRDGAAQGWAMSKRLWARAVTRNT